MRPSKSGVFIVKLSDGNYLATYDKYQDKWQTADGTKIIDPSSILKIVNEL